MPQLTSLRRQAASPTSKTGPRPGRCPHPRRPVHPGLETRAWPACWPTGFTVHTYDRRGRGHSGGTITDGPDREFDDLRAVIDHAGGHAHVYGSSGAGIIALQAASRGTADQPPRGLGTPPTPSRQPNPPADWGPQIASLIEASRRGDAVAYWMTTILGMPETSRRRHARRTVLGRHGSRSPRA